MLSTQRSAQLPFARPFSDLLLDVVDGFRDVSEPFLVVLLHRGFDEQLCEHRVDFLQVRVQPFRFLEA